MKIASVVMPKAVVFAWFMAPGFMKVLVPVGFVRGRGRHGLGRGTWR